MLFAFLLNDTLIPKISSGQGGSDLCKKSSVSAFVESNLVFFISLVIWPSFLPSLVAYWGAKVAKSLCEASSVVKGGRSKFLK